MRRCGWRNIHAQRHGAQQPAFRLDPPAGEDAWMRIAFAEPEMIADSAATVTTVLAAG